MNNGQSHPGCDTTTVAMSECYGEDDKDGFISCLACWGNEEWNCGTISATAEDIHQKCVQDGKCSSECSVEGEANLRCAMGMNCNFVYCSEEDMCGDDNFCNYDGDIEGLCEQCSDVMDSSDCYSDGLPEKGEKECAEICMGETADDDDDDDDNASDILMGKSAKTKSAKSESHAGKSEKDSKSSKATPINTEPTVSPTWNPTSSPTLSAAPSVSAEPTVLVPTESPTVSGKSNKELSGKSKKEMNSGKSDKEHSGKSDKDQSGKSRK